MYLTEARDISLYASKSHDTKTDTRSKRCGTTFQGRIEKNFLKGYQRDLSDFGKQATAKFKEQLNKVKAELDAMRVGMCMLVWKQF